MQAAEKKPAAVSAVGWIYIAVSGLMILSALMSLVMFAVMRKVTGGEFPPMGQGMPEGFKFATFMFKHYGLIAFVQLLVAGFGLYSGIEFLRLRAWARTALEVLTWLGLAYIVGFGIFWIVSWMGATSAFPPAEAGGPTAAFGIFGAVMGLVVSLVFAAPAIIIIVFLRKPEVRRAVSL